MKSSMKKSMLFLVATVITLSLIFISAPKVWAETTDCKREITGTDTIDSSGVYCLTANISTSATSGYAIEITTDDVVLDLNGHTIKNTSTDTTRTTVGIGTSSSLKNVTIKNGTVKGFYYGIGFSGVNGTKHLVEDIAAEGNTYRGIYVHGNFHTIRNNRVLNTGGSTVTSDIKGIFTPGNQGGRIINNDVSATTAAGSDTAYGISFTYANNAVVRNNRITQTTSGSGYAMGVHSYLAHNSLVEGNFVRGTTVTSGTNRRGFNLGGDYIDVVNNRVSDADIGFNLTPTSRYRDNIASNVTTKYSGSTNDLGNND